MADFPFDQLLANLEIGDKTAGNTCTIEKDGTIVLNGEAMCWDDLSGALVGTKIDVSNGHLDYNYFNGALGFQDNSLYPGDPVSIPLQFKHAMYFGAGAIALPHIHWYQSQAEAPNWLLAYKKVRNGQPYTIDTDFSDYIKLPKGVEVFPYTSGTIEQISRFGSGSIDISDMGVSDQLKFVLFRDTDNTSTLFSGADAVAGEVLAEYTDAHVLFNMFGSREETVK